MGLAKFVFLAVVSVIGLVSCALPKKVTWSTLDKSKAYVGRHHEFRNALDYNVAMIEGTYWNEQMAKAETVELDGAVYSVLPAGRNVLSGTITLSPRGPLLGTPTGRLILIADLESGRFYDIATEQKHKAIEYWLKDKKSGKKASSVFVFSY